ncbi:DNA-binding domain-containing protein [Thermoactinomyces sp. CICC 10521]|jgi:two-component system, response regulator YcbB|uniref:DNA-binding domain-containing protein n=1 Tax=Thermoactinomyces sp. CICC 10521 TaxID=2767426 RepID=UPI0018DB2334|nr:DNA-binding domain-containing protein [Thermoactinomyces sp. CICC 10521]MBH8607786.1 DNA-binding domain-containing protein [Thermoactinomyces sp. CICC 10521]
MRFYIVDDDKTTRWILAEIIEEGGLGEVVGEAENGAQIDSNLLRMKRVDILLIDQMMPERDGLETIRQLQDFQGKIVMISQFSSEEIKEEAYALKIEYYITKPIVRNEVNRILTNICEMIRKEALIHSITQGVLGYQSGRLMEGQKGKQPGRSLADAGKAILKELSINSESGSADLLDILRILERNQERAETEFPILKSLFQQVAEERLGTAKKETEIAKEVKAMEARIRRAIIRAMHYMAYLGSDDFHNINFENYAHRYFDLEEIHRLIKEMKKSKGAVKSSEMNPRVQMRKFISNLYEDARMMAME